jgi:hypothetical protein
VALVCRRGHSRGRSAAGHDEPPRRFSGKRRPRRGVERAAREQQLEELFDIDFEAWAYEAEATGQFFEQFGQKLPAQLSLELLRLKERLSFDQNSKVPH